MQEHIHIQEIITSLIYNVNPHQSNAALSFPASEQEKRTHNTLYIKLLQLFLRITTGVKEFIQHLDLILKSCFVFHENTSLANVDYNRNTAALFFFLRIT